MSLSLLLSDFEARDGRSVTGAGIEVEGGVALTFALGHGPDRLDEVTRPAPPGAEARLAAAVRAMVARVTTEDVPLPPRPAVTVEWSVASGALMEQGALVMAAADLPPEVLDLLPLMGDAWRP